MLRKSNCFLFQGEAPTTERNSMIVTLAKTTSVISDQSTVSLHDTHECDTTVCHDTHDKVYNLHD